MTISSFTKWNITINIKQSNWCINTNNPPAATDGNQASIEFCEVEFLAHQCIGRCSLFITVTVGTSKYCIDEMLRRILVGTYSIYIVNNVEAFAFLCSVGNKTTFNRDSEFRIGIRDFGLGFPIWFRDRDRFYKRLTTIDQRQKRSPRTPISDYFARCSLLILIDHRPSNLKILEHLSSAVQSADCGADCRFLLCWSTWCSAFLHF
jgi:hypothetical protein